MGYQANILNWRIQRGPEIGTDNTPIMLTISTNHIKIMIPTRDNYNQALNRKDTKKIDRATRPIIQHITEAKKIIHQTKYKTLQHHGDTTEMTNKSIKINQLNQQIGIMGCNRWQF